jgi:hypothetical protein
VNRFLSTAHFGRFFGFIAVILATVSAHAAGPVRLWDEQGNAVSGYGNSIRSLPPGLQIQLKDGNPPTVVTIGKFLGSGNTTVIYDIGGGRAIRFAKGEGLAPTGPSYEGFMIWYAEGAERIERIGAPVVKVFQSESVINHYIIVEKLVPPDGVADLYSLEDLVTGRVQDHALRARMIDTLMNDFAPKTWKLRFVGDMRSEQILYTSRGWLIADMSSTVRSARAIHDSTLFSAMGKLPISWRYRLEKQVLAARREAELNGSFAQLILAEVRRCIGWLTGAVAF